jgi:hypothetical protein
MTMITNGRGVPGEEGTGSESGAGEIKECTRDDKGSMKTKASRGAASYMMTMNIPCSAFMNKADLHLLQPQHRAVHVKNPLVFFFLRKR